MEKFDRAYQKFCTFMVRYVCGAVLLIQMLVVATNVTMRYVFKSPILAVYEYIGLGLVPIVYFALAYGWYRRGTFIVINVLQERLHGKAQWLFQFFIFLTAFVVFGLFQTYTSISSVFISFAKSELVGETGAFSLAWPWKTLLAMGMCMLDLRIFLDLVTMIKTRKIIPFNRK